MTRPQVAIRPLGPADSRELARLHAHVFDPAWSEAEFDRLLNADTTLGLAAVVPGEGTNAKTLAGAVLAQVVAGEADVLTVMVSADLQCRGVGRTLMSDLDRRLAAARVTRIVLEVGRGNVAALALYTGQGFRPVAERRGYYDAGSPLAETALVMEKLVGDVVLRPRVLCAPQ